MSPLIRGFSGAGRQRGAIGLMAAVTFALAVLCMLLVIDSGRLYLEKRSLQRVADVSALEAATRAGQCTPNATAAGYAITAATRNGFTVTDATRTLTTDCGTLIVGANNLRTFSLDATQNQAIRVVVTHSVARSIAAGVAALFPGGTPDPNIILSATAVASVPPPLAMLTIRSTLLVVDSSKSVILNALFGGLLGGSLNLDAVGWNGLLNTNISLLGYLDRLKLDLGITAVGYTQVLGATTSVGQLIQSAINVLDPNGTLSADATVASLIALKAAAGATQVVLGDVLQVKGGTETAALNANVQIFQLIEGLVQLANKKNGLTANLAINLGLINFTSRIQVIEPPQISAVGNPMLAAKDPLGPDRIYVQTAQVRALLSIKLPILDAANPLTAGLTSAISGIIGPLSNTLNSVLSLNLVGVVNSITCAVSCTSPSVVILPSPPPIGIDIALDIASGSSYVTGYSCVNPSNKSLTTNTNTSLLNVYIGRIDPTTVFPANTTTPTPSVIATPLKIIDIGTQTCTLIVFCAARTPGVGGGVGISANVALGQNTNTAYTYSTADPTPLPNVTQQLPDYKTYPTTNLVSGLSAAIAGVKVQAYGPAAGSPPGYNSPLGSVLNLVAGALTGITNSLEGIIQNALSPLLDPLINTLLASLGINLNQVDVGANLSCSAGQAALVI